MEIVAGRRSWRNDTCGGITKHREEEKGQRPDDRTTATGHRPHVAPHRPDVTLHRLGFLRRCGCEQRHELRKRHGKGYCSTSFSSSLVDSKGRGRAPMAGLTILVQKSYRLATDDVPTKSTRARRRSGVAPKGRMGGPVCC